MTDDQVRELEWRTEFLLEFHGPGWRVQVPVARWNVEFAIRKHYGGVLEGRTEEELRDMRADAVMLYWEEWLSPGKGRHLLRLDTSDGARWLVRKDTVTAVRLVAVATSAPRSAGAMGLDA